MSASYVGQNGKTVKETAPFKVLGCGEGLSKADSCAKSKTFKYRLSRKTVRRLKRKVVSVGKKRVKVRGRTVKVKVKGASSSKIYELKVTARTKRGHKVTVVRRLYDRCTLKRVRRTRR